MNNSIAYWVGVAESAAFEIEVNSQRIGEGYLWAQDDLDKAVTAHKEAMENLMRIADHSIYINLGNISYKVEVELGNAE